MVATPEKLMSRPDVQYAVFRADELHLFLIVDR
jgi:hypothetical protein